MGSAFKPFVYAAALEEGYVASQPLADRPFTLEEAGSPAWSPRNYDEDFRGAVSMRRALVESLNIPTVRLAMAVGMKEVARMAAALGISEPVPELPAAALGTTTASPLELAAAYGVLARNGMQAPHRSVTRVETASGRTLYEAPSEAREVMDPRVAYVVSDILTDAVREGTGAGARAGGYSGPVAGKTGTTQDAHDAWFVGYTPSLVGLVWIGFDRPRPILRGATGGGLAAPVWGRIMSRVDWGINAPESWPRPPGIVERTVDPSTGKVIEAGCATLLGDTVDELFLEEYLPVEDCPRPRGLLARFGSFLRSLGGPSSEPVETAHPGDEILGVDRVPLNGQAGSTSAN
jgi:penicillin-binding protein 1A